MKYPKQGTWLLTCVYCGRVFIDVKSDHPTCGSACEDLAGNARSFYAAATTRAR